MDIGESSCCEKYNLIYKALLFKKAFYVNKINNLSLGDAAYQNFTFM